MSATRSLQSSAPPVEVPLNRVEVGDEALGLLAEACRTGMLAQGPLVAAVEAEFARATGVAHCVAVSNGTVALTAVLTALGVGPGTTVVTTPFTFVATVNAALALGARIRFADIGEDYTIDPAELEAVLDSVPGPAVVLPVHLYGLVADMPAILDVAHRAGAAVVEDAAQAHGARLHGRAAGAWGRAGTFSLYGSKNVAAGEGGLITTDDADLAARLRVLRNQGMSGRYVYDGWGTNWRWSDLHAAVALPQVRSLEAINVRRRRNAARLAEELAGIEGLRLPPVPDGAEHVWHQYTIEVTPEAGITRDDLAAGLAAQGIASGIYYPHVLPDVPHLAAHELVTRAAVPVARRVAGRVLSVPVGHHLDIRDVERVAAAVRRVVQGTAGGGRAR